MIRIVIFISVILISMYNCDMKRGKMLEMAFYDSVSDSLILKIKGKDIVLVSERFSMRDSIAHKYDLTLKTKGNRSISLLEVTNDKLISEKGIKVGSRVEEVIDAYGKPRAESMHIKKSGVTVGAISCLTYDNAVFHTRENNTVSSIMFIQAD